VLRNTETHYEQQMWRYGLLAGTPHPQPTLDRLTHRIDHTQQRLDHARSDLTTLTREPALRTLPADRLTAERGTWQATRTAHQRAAIAHARTHPSTVRVGPAHDSLTPPPSPGARIRR